MAGGFWWFAGSREGKWVFYDPGTSKMLVKVNPAIGSLLKA